MNMGFMPSIRTGGQFAKRQAGLEQREGFDPDAYERSRTLDRGGMDSPDPGFNPSPGGGGGFMPTGPNSPKSGIGVDERAIGSAFDNLPQLQEDAIAEEMAKPENQNEDGSFNWHLIFGSLAAGVATALGGGGGVGGFLLGSASAMEGGFKGLLQGEKDKADRAKLQAQADKVANDRKLKQYKAMYDAQVASKDYLGAANSQKMANALMGGGSDIDMLWDNWAEKEIKNQEKEEASGKSDEWAEQASHLVTAGTVDENGKRVKYSEEEAWEYITTHNPLLMSDAMIRVVNGIDEDAVVKREHEVYAANVIERQVREKMEVGRGVVASRFTKARNDAISTHSSYVNGVYHRVDTAYEREIGSPGIGGVAKGQTYEETLGQYSNARQGEGFNPDAFERIFLKELTDDYKRGRLDEELESYKRIGSGPQTMEELLDRISAGHSSAFRTQAMRLAKGPTVKRPGAPGADEPLRVVDGKLRGTRTPDAGPEFTQGLHEGPRQQEAKVHLHTGKVVEEAIRVIQNMPAGKTIEDETAESIIDKLSATSEYGPILEDQMVKNLAIQSLKGRNTVTGDNDYDLVQYIYKNSRPGVKKEWDEITRGDYDGNVGVDKLVDEEADKIIKDANEAAKKEAGIISRRGPRRSGGGFGQGGAGTHRRAQFIKEETDRRVRERLAQIEESIANQGNVRGGGQGVPVPGMGDSYLSRLTREKRGISTFEDEVVRQRPTVDEYGRSLTAAESFASLPPDSPIRENLENIPGLGASPGPVSKMEDSVEIGTPGGMSFSNEAFRFGNETSQLDDNVVAVVNAIEKRETGGEGPATGETGELRSRLQFLPETWKEWAGEILGDENAELTAENERKVAYFKIKQWLDEGLDVRQVASKWNSGDADWERVGSGISSRSARGRQVRYDTPRYSADVENFYKEIVGQQGSPA